MTVSQLFETHNTFSNNGMGAAILEHAEDNQQNAPISALSNSDTWQAVQEVLKEKMSQPSFETWISPLKQDKVTDTQATLIAESAFNRDWVLKHYRPQIKQAYSAVLNNDIEITIDIEDSNPEDAGKEELPTASKDDWRPWTPKATKSNLNPRYTFEQCVIGEHNRFCHAAALAVAESPAVSYNPFFIHGGVGLGKTHLIQAIGHFAHRHHPDLNVRYVTAEAFTNDLIHGLSTRDMKAFRDRYRKIDILIIDDVQFLEGKERTQEEMFHTFNALHESGKQIILSSDRPPKQLGKLTERLKSRFEWGLIADIQSPDLETRMAILRKKCEREHINLPEDVLNFVADMHPNNIRELEGALNKVAAYAMLTRTLMDVETAQKLLGSPVDKANINIESIIDTTANYYHLRSGDLKSPSRAKDVSHARQVAIYLIRTMTETSFPKIGAALGNRKHTTILYAYDKMTGEIEQHPSLKQQINEIQGRINTNR